MSVSGYFENYISEIDRISNSYHEARLLGQDEKAQELVDELYKCAYDHHQNMKSLFEATVKVMRTIQNPEAKEVFEDYVKRQSKRLEESTRDLDELILNTLGSTS